MVYHSRYYLSIVTKRGTFGAPASANVFTASVPITTELLIAEATQKNFEADWSRLPVYVSTSVTDLVIREDPLHTHLDFLYYRL